MDAWPVEIAPSGWPGVKQAPNLGSKYREPSGPQGLARKSRFLGLELSTKLILRSLRRLYLRGLGSRSR